MAHYAIGDLQGCCDELLALLNQIDFNHGKDTLWLVGDIVNRGPQSLESLQFVMQHESSVQMVLGNHDLHLLAQCYGYGKLKKSDTLTSILKHPKLPEMRDFLRHQPLLHQNEKQVLVHAGLLPEWTVAQATQLANEVENTLQSTHPERFFAHMYGNQPAQWSNNLEGFDRLRMITNVFTRMRVLNADGSLDYDYKSTYDQIPAKKHAWFDAKKRKNLSYTIIFGHWSALGLHNKKNVIALDTGAVWGGQLTAVDLQTGKFHSRKSKNYKNWQSI